MGLKILGISAYYHDSAAALLHDGEIVFAVQEERLSRKKHDSAFPENAVRACLKHGIGGKPLSMGDLDAVVFYDKPLVKFERLMETYYAFAPRGLEQFVSSIPVWVREKLFLKQTLRRALRRFGGNPKELLFSEHHLSHAASAFYPSPFGESAIVTVDGVGEWATATIGRGDGAKIQTLREQHFPHSIGLLYSAFTYYTGFKVNSGEYKLMGLAPYGDPSSDRVKRYTDIIKTELSELKPDGSLWLNQNYFDYATGLKMAREDAWEKLFGIALRKPESELTQPYCDMALAIQNVTEEAVTLMAREAAKLTGSKNLCLAGGVALNCVANGKLLRSGLFDNIWIQPAAGDAGGALGAALAAHHIFFAQERKTPQGRDSMRGAYLGPEYSQLDTELMSRDYGAVYETLTQDALCEKTAELLASGAVVGWHQGREEWGPRALGNRTILGDPRNPEMQKKLNLKIKYRESFRPFAPSVLAEDAAEYFEKGFPSPYMLLVDFVAPARRKPLPENYHSLPLKEKLYHLRSDIPAVTHLDYSARVQTVHNETNPLYHQLITTFKKLTGYGIIVNTSFNVRGEPIVCTPEDAYKCFMRTEMDYLVVGNCLFDKARQPRWEEKSSWRQEYALD
ncbi:MAG: carbamoyltransferase [Elusimicrobia bacterium]|nr:carbamoyltransferase [Elusimicrobiota bacterium]